MTLPRAGAAVIDLAPPPGLAMSGFAARGGPALGTHDPLTVRALAVEDTAVVCADVVGLHEDSCARIAARCGLAPGHLVVTALHTHGGPVSMPGRLGGPLDAAWLARLEQGCVEAVANAMQARRPALFAAGAGADPGVGRNRRHPGGPVDAALPVLRIGGTDGRPIATVVSYGCHPVVVGADNRLFTADYPGTTRRALEADQPGTMALFLTGCAGDVNTGHSAQASISLAAQAGRTFADAERIGLAVARAAAAAPLRAAEGDVAALSASLLLPLAVRDPRPRAALIRLWREELGLAAPARVALLRLWIDWAETTPALASPSWPASVTLLRWPGLLIAALPGEIFAATGLALRAALAPHAGGRQAMVIGYANGCPGYLPPRDEYAQGGYEVDEAHRYYGLSEPFAAGGAERLAQAVLALATR